tara:strand:+ start:103 stop:306 length:204 start_codon:yes stop_codon:yes gene_type:complete
MTVHQIFDLIAKASIMTIIIVEVGGSLAASRCLANDVENREGAMRTDVRTKQPFWCFKLIQASRRIR